MKRYIKNVILVLSIIVLFIILNAINMPKYFLSSKADKYAFTVEKKKVESATNSENLETSNHDPLSLLELSGVKASESSYDELDFHLEENYFNYEISDPNYDYVDSLPDKEGKVAFQITTENIPNIQYGAENNESTSEKYVMMENARLFNTKGEDVTSNFTKSVVNADDSNTFILVLDYNLEVVNSGDYTLRMVYALDGHELLKEKKFRIGNNVKELQVSRVEIKTETMDNRLHKNIDGTYRLYYESDYIIDPEFLEVNIYNGEERITDKFTVSKSAQDKYIDIKYVASTNLEAGDFNVIIKYQDQDMEDVTTVTKNIKLYGDFKKIVLDNLKPSATPMYADKEEQYYTFTVDKQAIIDDIANLKWIITDDEGKNVTNNFKVTNNLNEEDNFKVEIIPFKNPVGTYHLRLYLLEDNEEDKEEERMYSNPLDIIIDDTYYEINMSSTSTLSQVRNYNTQDKTSIYDRDGAKGNYSFTSTYPYDDLSQYTLAITDTNGKIIKELDSAVTNTDDILSVNFNTGSITNPGDYKVMVCINHLPYTGLDMKVVKFIPVAKVAMKINNTNVSSSYTVNSNTTYATSYVVEPSNATNKNFVITSSNTNVANINGINIVTKNSGSSTISLTNGDVTVTIVLKVQDYLSSSLYTINHADHTIFVSSMTKKELTKSEFLKNITGYTSYQILDASNKDITKSATYIGTSMSLKVSGISYKIIVIGDVTGDGKINTGDVSQLFQHIRKKKITTDKYKLKAASVRKQSSTNTGDVSKLFQFVRNKISKL